ncbi:ABC transporter permease [Fulvivirgaceae bacterium PWU4]|uniref:ABC transporter permease n=1 Tax=Chryseosolibacter histidini TaxID=2782349 RepID=A0AAP2DIC4_9BACT|nr:ABC transporter permease [Chryseosolibacter histidini]MBT1695923.1 ABC transporter permease [Chryseosolibacter histidini]
MSTSSRHEPPQWVKRFLGMFLEPRLLEASLGDLEEKFRSKLQRNTPHWKTKLLYTLEGLGFMRMARRPRNAGVQTTINMISHTLLFFTRLVRKDKSYYLVSLLGLMLSLASFLFIMMFINDELAYDKFHERHPRIFRVAAHLKSGDVEFNMAATQFPAAQALQSELPEIEQAVRIFKTDPMLHYGDKKFQERVVMADSNFFDVFTFPLIVGDAETAMNEPASIILTERAAKKYFGDANPIGKTLLVDGQQPLAVTGVMRNVPEQSHIRFDAVVPLTLQLNQWRRETGLEGRENKWYWYGAYTYIMLKTGVAPDRVRAKLPLVVNKYFPERFRPDAWLELQPVADIHLNSNLAQELEPGGNILYVRLFSIVAFVIMIVSSINLINLSYFKITSRTREVGIRKFLGQNAMRIIIQLSIESILIGVTAFVLAVILCQIFISDFNLLVQKNLYLWTAPNGMIMGGLLALIILICIVAVVRPAIRYAMQASSYLLLQQYRSPDKARLRNILMGLQVCFSFVLLVFSFIISRQIDFFRNKDLGFDRHNIVLVNMNEDLWPKLEAFKTELQKSKDIVEVSGGPVPGTGCNTWRFVPEGGSYEKPVMMPFAWVDYKFLSALKIKLLMGRDFDPEAKYDSAWPFIINRRAAIELGWLDDPLNRTLEVFAAGTTKIMAKGIVIGVIEDYHFESLHGPVKPIVLTPDTGFGTAIIRVSGTSPESGIASIGALWKKFSDKPFEYEALDRQLERLYDKESRLSNVILFFTVIALYLTCYGLFAMSSLLFSSRLKEVAIRKVFGADQMTIVRQLYTRYAVFNLIAIVVGVPIAMYLGNLWLQTFQYRIDLDSALFIKAGVCILLAGLLSVSYYLARVAFSDPVRFLRRD